VECYNTRAPVFSWARSTDGGSSNGRTLDFDSRYRGSNPCPPAKTLDITEGGSQSPD
jgi:hypothetical protein